MERLAKDRRPWILVPALALVLVVSACGGSRPEPPAAESDWEVRVESPLDTMDVAARETAEAAPPGETATPAAEPVVPESVETVETVPAPPPETPATPVPDPRQFTPGWRVQIAALSSLATAEEVAARARERLREPVYVEYEAPLYKVRVGDFLVREEAESLKTRAVSQDFEKAWVVETLVVKPAR